MLKSILRGTALFLLFIIACAAIFLQTRTYVSVWIPSGIAACSGLISALTLSGHTHRITGIRHHQLNAAVTFAATGIIILFAVLCTNYVCASPKSAHIVRAELTSKNARTEYGTRRTARGRYVRDMSRKIYHYEYTLRLPDGHTLKRSTDAGHYVHLRIGRTYPVELRRGAFGWTVIR